RNRAANPLSSWHCSITPLTKRSARSGAALSADGSWICIESIDLCLLFEIFNDIRTILGPGFELPRGILGTKQVIGLVDVASKLLTKFLTFGLFLLFRTTVINQTLKITFTQLPEKMGCLRSLFTTIHLLLLKEARDTAIQTFGEFIEC